MQITAVDCCVRGTERDKLLLIQCCLWFNELNQQELEQLVKKSRLVSFLGGEVLFYEGDAVTDNILISCGEVNVLRMTLDGDEKIFGTFTSYDLIAMPAVFMSHMRYPMTIRAKTDGQALLINSATIRQLSENSILFANKLIRQFSQLLYNRVNQIDWLTSSSASERLAAYLLKCRETQLGSSILELPLNRSQLAAILGVRSETISRILTGWKKQQKLSITGNSITICDLRYFSELATGEKRNF